MSQTQFIEFGDRGFWAYDVILQVLLKHLIDVAVAMPEASEGQWLAAAIPTWRRTASISDYGFCIDKMWTERQLTVFVGLIDKTCSLLAQRDGIPAEEITRWKILGDLRIFTRGMSIVPTKPVVQLGEAIRALVNGSLPAAPVGTMWLYTTRDNPETIRIRTAI
jgi:hypothetical protein